MIGLYHEHYSKLATGAAPGAPSKEELITQLARADERVRELEAGLDNERLARCQSVMASSKHTKDFMQAKVVNPLEADRDRLRRENEELRGLLKVAKCPNCDGSGAKMVRVRGEERATREMAIDAGDPQLEGSLVSDEQWEPEQCQWCADRIAALTRKEE